jgi:hypothetical protein
MPVRRVFIPCLCLWVTVAACSPSAPSARTDPCDVSDATFKRDLDARYPIASTQAVIEAARGKPSQQYLRAAVPPADPWLNRPLAHAAARHGAKGASVAVYDALTGTGGFASGAVYKDVLIFDPAGKLEWSYRFKLD